MSRYFASFILASALAGSLHGAARAADAVSAEPSCFSSAWDFLYSSLRDCPLKVGPVTLYGNIDGGYGHEAWGAPMGLNADKPNYAIQRSSARPTWLWSPNGTSTSVIGLRLAQKVFGEWEVIGVAEAGYNPFTFRLINGAQSLADNNLYSLPDQRTSFDSSRAGQWDNSQGFAGLSHPTYGTLTYGRTNSLSQSALGAYDPTASTAFSQLGFSGGYAGFGATQTTRVNSALTYRLTYQGVRAAFQAQLGGYGTGNGATSQYQGQIGFDYEKFSFDAIGGWAQNVMSLSTYGGGTLPAGYDPNSIVRATLSNSAGFMLLGRYDWKPFRFYLGYIYARSENPSNTYYPFGMNTVADGIIVPPGAVTTSNFTVARVLSTVWTGMRYDVMKNLQLSTGVYWETQNNFLAPPDYCTGTGTSTSSSRCAGGRYSYSFMANYQVTPRINFYGGLMVSTVYGGLANGFQHAQNVDPTVGVRFRF